MQLCVGIEEAQVGAEHLKGFPLRGRQGVDAPYGLARCQGSTRGNAGQNRQVERLAEILGTPQSPIKLFTNERQGKSEQETGEAADQRRTRRLR